MSQNHFLVFVYIYAPIYGLQKTIGGDYLIQTPSFHQQVKSYGHKDKQNYREHCFKSTSK